MRLENKMYNQFIELDRQFYSISDDAAGADDFESRIEYGFSKPLSWEDILKQPRSVMIAGAGAGKTEEIKQQTIKLRQSGKPAFFLRLENLKVDFEFGFEEAELGNFEDFEAWHGGSAEGWFFLDSVDEAKLRDPRDFEFALHNFDKTLGSRREAAYIVVTSRLTWEPITDLNLVKKRLPCKSLVTTIKEQNSDEEDSDIDNVVSKTDNALKKQNNDQNLAELKVYSLVGLDDVRIKRFVEALNTQDVDGFMEALNRSDAQNFAARPKDLVDLIAFWNEKGEIGSALELVQHSVDTKIVEADNNRAEFRFLNKDGTLKALQRIAAATCLTEWNKLNVPGNSSHGKAIPVGELIPDLEVSQIKALLELPIFDESVYGKVRFHHRSVQEYLAAGWFLNCLEEGTRQNVSQLFFREQYGFSLITPSLRPILPWIAIFDDEFRQKALAISPEILLKGGDSTQFPLETRKTILLNVCENLAANKANRESFDLVTVQRFAKAGGMEDTVVGLFEKYTDNTEIKDLLLGMVWHGKYTTCSEIALKISLDEKEAVYTRTYAIRAVRAADVGKHLQELAHGLIHDSERPDHRVATDVVRCLVPDWISVQQLNSMLEKIEPPKDVYDRSGLKRSLKEKIDNLEIADLEIFLEHISTLLMREPHVKRHECDISEQFKWLVGTCFWILRRLAKAQSNVLLEKDVLLLIQSLGRFQFYSGYDDYDDVRKQFSKLVSDWGDLNKALLWSHVQTKRERSETPINICPWRSFCSLDKVTLDDAIEWIESKKLVDDKLIAQSIAFIKYAEDGRQRKQRERLKKIASEIPELKADLHRQLNPSPKSEEDKKRVRSNANFAYRQKKREERQAKNREDWKSYIIENVEEITDTSHAHENMFRYSQRVLFERMREKDHSNSLRRTNWHILQREFNKDVAKAFRKFLIDCSRKYKPVLKSEREDNSSIILKAVTFGLSGLEIEAAETQNWTASLDNSEASNIIRYALEELNGVPGWLQQFYEHFPDLVQRHFIQEIGWELTKYDGESPSIYALSKLKYHCDWLHQILTRPLFQILENNDVLNVEHLKNTLQIILADESVTNEEIASLAECRTKDTSDLNISAIWFAAWVSVNPPQAMVVLKKKLSELASVSLDDAQKIAMYFVVALVGSFRRDHSINSRYGFKSPKFLSELFLLLNEYIRVDEDIDRADGGVYSPELRDDAQDARGALFKLLTQIPGKEAFLALQRIVEEHPYEPARVWMQRDLISRAEIDADISNWSIADVVKFEDESEKKPNLPKELFQMGINHLIELKNWIEDGDDSPASTWIKEEEEINLRILITGWLRNRSGVKYTVHPEEEQTDKKRPDIRLHTTNVDAPVPIELKIADNGWSGVQLFERLKNQLCNDYLRDYRTKYGIYLLFYRGEQQSWKHPETRDNMDFNQLIQSLTDKTTELCKTDLHIEDLYIIGVDLTKRRIEKRNG